MNEKAVQQHKRNTELMILDALQTFTQETRRRVRSISFDFESEPDGTQRAFTQVTLTLDDEE